MIALLLAFYSFKNSNVFGNNLILEQLNLDVSENAIDFKIEIADQYTLCFLGCKDLNLNQAKLNLGKADKEISLRINFLKYSFFHKGQNGIEYFNFLADETGQYRLLIKNTKSIQFFFSRLASMKMILGSKKTSDISILIKKYNHPLKKISVLVPTILSLMLFSLGIILLLKKF
ncbi:MAG: hypothetical protein DI622_08445 [Chryseobacterium sp.]|nr:hypothetical protein [Chryseobacterium sp.]PZU19857.1 MAG: hypothetical protein DI622_08445 [Chryseobacterium sp.]